MIQKKLQNENGFATLIALIMVGMLTLIGLAALSTSDDEVTITGNELQETKAFYAAEAGLEMASARLHFLADSGVTVISSMPSGKEEVNNCVIVYETVDNGPASEKVLNNGTLAGMRAMVKSYSMVSSGSNAMDNSMVQLSQDFEQADIPIFQFAAFYNGDLEISPDGDMDFIGRFHANGDIYIQSNGTLNIESYLTAAGNIHHGRKGPGIGYNGDILIKDGDGNYQSMKDGGGWLESSDSHWYDSSIARWDGRVQDSTHGQTTLEFPLLGATGDPHKLIEREAGNPDSYEAEASLKFIDGDALQLVGGIWNDVTADMTAKGIIAVDTFYDEREDEWVDATELDIGLLYAEGYAPANHIIYFSDQIEDFPVLRLNNASILDTSLAIISENPVYTLGDFNSINKRPASIISDALTCLSNDWLDADSDKNKNQRVAANTTVNACIMTGNVETTSSDYNGGFENLPRLLEKWTNKTFTLTGSLINLWNSQQAVGLWSTGFFSDPNRAWSFDTSLDNPAFHPPATPTIRIFQRTGWHQEDVNYQAVDMYTIEEEVIN